jgi:predicted AAA+ superfamily ATPase
MNLSDLLPVKISLAYKNKIRKRIFNSMNDFEFYRKILITRASRRISRNTGIVPICSNSNCGFVANMGYYKY